MVLKGILAIYAMQQSMNINLINLPIAPLKGARKLLTTFGLAPSNLSVISRPERGEMFRPI